MFAQSLIEYGALGSIVTGIQQFASSAVSWITDRSVMIGIAVSLVVIVVWRAAAARRR